MQEYISNAASATPGEKNVQNSVGEQTPGIDKSHFSLKIAVTVTDTVRSSPCRALYAYIYT